MGLQEETAEVLGRLIRFNTVNPPGQERACQEYLRDYLTEAGFECEMDGVEAERPNLVARLRGEAEGPVLGYLSHVDTVLASPEDWSRASTAKPTARSSATSRTSTRCSPTRPTGATTPGREKSTTGSSGVAAPST